MSIEKMGTWIWHGSKMPFEVLVSSSPCSSVHSMTELITPSAYGSRAPVTFLNYCKIGILIVMFVVCDRGGKDDASFSQTLIERRERNRIQGMFNSWKTQSILFPIIPLSPFMSKRNFRPQHQLQTVMIIWRIRWPMLQNIKCSFLLLF